MPKDILVGKQNDLTGPWNNLRYAIIHAIVNNMILSNITSKTQAQQKHEWQDIWDCCEGNKLHSIYPTVGIIKHSKNMSRYNSVLLNRLRIGHSRLTHSYLLCCDDPPTCQSCGIPLTVKHILVECTNMRDICEKYFTVSSVTHLFKSIDYHTIINQRN